MLFSILLINRLPTNFLRTWKNLILLNLSAIKKYKMKINYCMIFLFYLAINSITGQIQIGQDIDGKLPMDILGISTSLSANGMRIAIGAPQDKSIDYGPGYVNVYELNSGVWVQIGQTISGSGYDGLGSFVSITADGKRVAIGAPGNSFGGLETGFAQVYHEINGNWVQIGQNIVGSGAYDEFGRVSISADGKRLAIGADAHDAVGPNSGKVRIFQENNGSWVQIGQDLLGEALGDAFGFSVSLSSKGKRVAIGAPFNDGNGPNAGQVRVFEENNGNWIQIGQDIDGEYINTAYQNGVSGRGVSITGDGKRIVIGAYRNCDSGVWLGMQEFLTRSMEAGYRSARISMEKA